MLAAMFYGPGDLRMEERPRPQPGPGEVLVQVAAATTCGTDLKTFRRGHPLLFRQLPAGFGHEVSGVVAEIGAGVTTIREGDMVAIANSAPCYQCFYCRRGSYSLCEDLLLLNGAYAEYILVPERIVTHNLHRLPPGTSFIAAALAEPLACALHGVDGSDVQSGDTVVVLGSGPLGLLLTAAAALRGARVILTGRGEERLRLGTHFGASQVLDVAGMTPQEQCEAIRQQTEEGRGADIVIEAIGTPETWQLAAQMTRPGGLVNLFGGCASGTRVQFETRPIHYSELTIKGIFHHTPTYYAQALRLITAHQVNVEALISQRLPLASALDAINLLTRKKGVKYALLPPAYAHLLDTGAAPD